jgi:hypothetical protein
LRQSAGVAATVHALPAGKPPPKAKARKRRGAD